MAKANDLPFGPNVGANTRARGSQTAFPSLIKVYFSPDRAANATDPSRLTVWSKTWSYSPPSRTFPLLTNCLLPDVRVLTTVFPSDVTMGWWTSLSFSLHPEQSARSADPAATIARLP